MPKRLIALVAAAALGWPAPQSVARPLPTVASINLCTDQLVLSLADDAQILTLSWLSANPHESMLAAEARRFPPNYGSAEEILRHDPDVVIAGSLTNTFTRSLLETLGFTVVTVPPEQSIADIVANIRTVAAAIDQHERGETVVAELEARIERHRRAREGEGIHGIVVRPGGFTVEAPSLAHELMTLAGVVNVSAELGLDRWGSLSIETLVRADPELLIFADYRADDSSLANAVTAHPALDALADRAAHVAVPSAQWGCGLPESLDSVDTLRHAVRALERGRRP